MSVSLIQSVEPAPIPLSALGRRLLRPRDGISHLRHAGLFGYPARSDSVDFATGMWGIWMPGFMQFITGIYLFAGLTLFGTFKTPSLYMAALAFTAYGVHWFALGWNRLHPRRPAG